jgi:hypothetical protein
MKQKFGFLGSIEIREYASQKLSITYRPIILWLLLGMMLLGVGTAYIWAVIKFPDFRLFTSTSSLGGSFLCLNVLHHLGSIIELEFNLANGKFRFRKRLFASTSSHELKLREFVRVEGNRENPLSPVLCLLFINNSPIYVRLFLTKMQDKIVEHINEFLGKKIAKVK